MYLLHVLRQALVLLEHLLLHGRQLGRGEEGVRLWLIHCSRVCGLLVVYFWVPPQIGIASLYVVNVLGVGFLTGRVTFGDG